MSAVNTAGLQLSCANASWRLVALDDGVAVFSSSSADNSVTLDDVHVENIDGSTTSCEMDLSWGTEVAVHSNVILRQIQSVSNARFVEVYDGDMNYVATLKGVLMTENVAVGTTKYTTDLSVINLMLNNQRRARLKFVSIKSGQLTITKLTATLQKPVEAVPKGATSHLRSPPSAMPESSSSVDGGHNHNNIVVMAQVEMMTRRFLQEMESLLDRKLAPIMHKLEGLQTQLNIVQAMHANSSSESTTVVPPLLSSPAIIMGKDNTSQEETIETFQIDRIAASSSVESDGDLELKNDMKSLMMMLRRGGIDNES